jgi:hypothetical protein
MLRVESLNGEIHFVFAEPTSNENTKNDKEYDETEIRRIMRKEVSKPLLLVRSE